MKTPFALLTLVALIACGDTTAPLEDVTNLKLGIESGNFQVTLASKPQLIAPIVGRLVRTPDGKVAFNFVDAILPTKAYAQGTKVNGSPIVGAVVCAVSITTANQLVPFVPCTNTDSTGHATFYFKTTNFAGDAKAEIRGIINNSPAVFDTAVAVVLPDSTVSLSTRLKTSPLDLGTLAIGDTIRLDTEITRARDVYGNDVTDWTADYSFSPDSITGSSYSGAWPASTASGRKPVVPAGARTLFIQIGKSKVWFKVRTK